MEKLSEINPLELPSLPLSARAQLPNCPAIYFVLDGARVLYIGKSVTLRSRWMSHHRLKQVSSICTYPRLAWMEIGDKTLLDEIERVLICHFQPALNNQEIPDELSSASPRIWASIPGSVHAELSRIARSQGRSVGNLISFIVEDWVNRRTSI